MVSPGTAAPTQHGETTMIAAINWVNVLNISVQMLADARAFEARATEDAAFPALVDTP